MTDLATCTSEGTISYARSAAGCGDKVLPRRRVVPPRGITSTTVDRWRAAQNLEFPRMAFTVNDHSFRSLSPYRVRLSMPPSSLRPGQGRR
jgi:hypothetical protein